MGGLAVGGLAVGGLAVGGLAVGCLAVGLSRARLSRGGGSEVALVHMATSRVGNGVSHGAAIARRLNRRRAAPRFSLDVLQA